VWGENRLPKVSFNGTLVTGDHRSFLVAVDAFIVGGFFEQTLLELNLERMSFALMKNIVRPSQSGGDGIEIFRSHDTRDKCMDKSDE